MITKVYRVPTVSFEHSLLPSTNDLFELSKLEWTGLHWVCSISAVQVVPVLKRPSVAGRTTHGETGAFLTSRTGTPFATRLFGCTGSAPSGRG
jgi:hypothetical protein